MSDERDFVRMAAGRGTTPSDYDVCLYHSNCPDGIGGAYPFWKANHSRRSRIPVVSGMPL